MDLGQTVEILTQLGLGAVVTFFAILLWSYTRDSAWMLVIIGIILKFGEVMYSTFVLFGIVRPGLLVIEGVAVGKVVLLALPYMAFTAAFIIMVLRSRVRMQTLSDSIEKDKEQKDKEKGKERRRIRKEKTAEKKAVRLSAAEETAEAAEESEAAAQTQAADRAVQASTSRADAERAEEIEEAAEMDELEEMEEIDEIEEVEEAEPDA